MTTLTLPIVVGKKYVRRDGVVVEARPYGSKDSSIKFACVATGSEPQDDDHAVFRQHGCTWTSQDSPTDLVSDYIEPAKGLTIDHFGLIKEDSYGRLGFIGFVTSGDGGDNPVLPLVEACIERLQKAKQEELDRIANLPKPDPHAENAAEYAKDMAQTDKAWERWEFLFNEDDEWQDCQDHPSWTRSVKFRRKEQA